MAARVSDETKLYICEMLEKGCTYRQIKQDLHVSVGTISAVKKEFYKEDDVNNRVIAGDKFNGVLEDRGKGLFVGTCRTQDGRFENRRFHFKSSNEAKKQWEEWKKSIHEKEKPVDKSPIKVDPVRVIRKTQLHPEGVSYSTQHKDEDAAVTQVAIPKNRVYILAVGAPKIAGWYSDYDEAKRAMRIANQALKFAGVDIRYSVVEVEESTFGNEE